MPLSPDTPNRRQRVSPLPNDYLLALAIALIVGLWIYTRMDAAQTAADHEHLPGPQGGVILSLAGDAYHAEALVEQGGVLRLMMLGPSASTVIDIQSQALVAFVTGEGGDATRVPLVAEPQVGDDPGRTSQFAGQLPAELTGKPIQVTIAALRIGDQRYRLGFAWPHPTDQTVVAEHSMPAKIQDEAERTLYLEPGGRYTAADIQANGGLTASQAFVGFRAQHDLNPQAGDLLCPISQTKANPDCSWFIGGRRYLFCCPPCIDEFVELAKQHPEQLRPPEAYVKVAPHEP